MEWWTCLVLLCATAVLADDEWLNVTIAQGQVRGRKLPNADLYAFYNVPYATAPLGEYKFKAPLPPPTWSEPFIATGAKSIVCPQNNFTIHLMPDNIEIKEDCLIANIYVPKTTEKNLSVLVYVHGGGFLTGFGNLYKGSQLMNQTKDFIMVTFNYRLSIHGFLCLGTEDAPGNAGMKDQVAALRWVQQNIASFGGNPDDVTLGGASAGSAAVDLIMLSKSAEGLFHRVIPESGSGLGVFAVQRDPLEIAKTFARKQNIDNVDDIKALELFYKTAPMDLLISDDNMFDNRTDSSFAFVPCVERDTDGAFLTESPLSILKKGDFKKVPVLHGFANMEGRIRYELFDSWKELMNEKFSDFLPADLKFESEEEREEVANKVKTFYFDNNPVSNDNILGYIDFFSDVLIAYPVLRATKLYAEAGHNRVYLYEYSFVDENDPFVNQTNIRGADHCAQTAAWLGNINNDESGDSPEFRKMRKIVREIWHNFIKTGQPVRAGSSLPAWPTAGANRSPHMVMDEEVVLRGVLLENRTRFWDDIYDKYYLDAVPPRSGASSTAQKSIFNLLVMFILFHITKRILE